MEKTNILTLIITLVVGVILTGALLGPVISDASKTTATYTNEGFLNAVKLDETSEHTLSFDYTAPLILTVDGVDIDMSNLDTTYSSATVIFSNDWFLRYNYNSGVILYKCGTSSAQGIKGAIVSNELSLDVTISSGTATFEYSDDVTYEYDIADAGLMITSEKSDYVLKKATETVFVNADSEVYGVGRTDRALGASGTSFNAMVKASVDGGVSAIYYSPQYTWSENSAVNYTANDIGKDLYNLTGFTFNLVDNSEEEHAVTYNQIFVPAEVTSELTNHLTPGQISLMGAIPVMVIVALLMAAVGAIALRRAD